MAGRRYKSCSKFILGLLIVVKEQHSEAKPHVYYLY